MEITRSTKKFIASVVSIFFALLLMLGMTLSASASGSSTDTDPNAASKGYTAVKSGTVTWQMIYDNPGVYYIYGQSDKMSGFDYCKLVAGKDGSKYYVEYIPVSLSMKEDRYIRQDTNLKDDSGSHKEWEYNKTYTGGTLYMKGVAPTTYTVTWMNQDGTQTLETDTKVTSGTKPSYDGGTPTKASTAQYTYTFAGWSTSKNSASGTAASNLPSVTGNTTYYAAFSQTTRSYTITFRNTDGSTLTTQNIAYGSSPTKPTPNPTKAETDYSSYTFLGWALSPDATETSGTVYTNTLPNIYGETTFYPVFKETRKTYQLSVQDVTLYMSDKHFEGSPFYGYGKEDMGDDNTGFAYVYYTLNGTEYDSESNGKYRFVFESEDEGIAEHCASNGQSDYWIIVYGNPGKTTVRAKLYTTTDVSDVEPLAETTFTVTVEPASYTVTYLNGDGNVLDTETVEHGKTPKGTDKIPTKESTDRVDYIFNGWSPELGTITGDTTYKPTFTEKTRTYEITFVGEDGKPISYSEIAYDETPTAPEAPIKASTAEYTYTFSGWSPAITKVTGPATYTATYSSTKNKYAITYLDANGETFYTEEVEYGTVPKGPAENPTLTDETGQYTYNFTGWSPALTEVTGAATYKPTFNNELNGYHIIIENYTGTVATTNIDPEAYYKGEVTVTVQSGVACALGIHEDGGESTLMDQNGTYSRLKAAANKDGTYSFTVNVEDKDLYLVLVVKGDSDLNGRTNLRDANNISKNYTKRMTLNNLQSFAADTDGNSRPNLRDANNISKNYTKRLVIGWDV